MQGASSGLERRLNTAIQSAAQLLSAASAVVCLTGAGVSAESGVPTFRDAQTGLWRRYQPEELASPQGFARNPGLVWRWYMWRLSLVEEAQPNAGHQALAALAHRVHDWTLVTQNVDSLHEEAGSPTVLHLHGSLMHFRCDECHHTHELLPAEREAEHPPLCRLCGGLVRPDVVWFGEALPRRALEQAVHAAQHCHVMLVVGTSGLVYPAAQLPQLAKEAGAALIDVNPQPGPLARLADVQLRGPSGKVLPHLLSALLSSKEP